MMLKVKILDDDAILPEKAHVSDAGYDLFAAIDCSIAPGARVQIHTKIALQIPDGYVGLIWDKSSLSHKKGLKILGGVIDSGYRGELLVGMINFSKEEFGFVRGDKIAQIIFQEYVSPDIIAVKDLDVADRGDAGFGSTGV